MSSSSPDTSPAGVVSAEAILQNPATLRDLLAVRSYLWFWVGRLCATLAVQVQAIALAWQVYAVARQTGSVAQASLAVGMLGLAQFLPMFALTLFAGHSADIYDRRKIMMAGLGLQLITSALFSAMAYGGTNLLWPIYGVAALFGCARAFYTPSSAALAPTLVERRLIPRAIVLNSAGNQMATIIGPAIGGLLVAFSPVAAFVVSGALCLASLVSLMLVASPPRQPRPTASRWALIAEGLNFVWSTKIVLGAISLDLFAAVGVDGLSTLVFALLRSMVLSVAALAILGAADMVSVFVRQTLVQIVTPDPMRGRVSAVSSLFIGASNELGEFESGGMARLLGPVGSAIFGGCGAIVVTLLWAWIFPALRKADRLE